MAGCVRMLLAWSAITLALSCKDVGVIGQDSLCPTACAADQRCDPARKACVRCVTGSDCDRGEPSACRVDEDKDIACIACVRDSDCDTDAPYCDDGRCGECDDDEDCASDARCEDQRCKLSSDEPEESDDPPSTADAGVRADAGEEDKRNGQAGKGSDDP